MKQQRQNHHSTRRKGPWPQGRRHNGRPLSNNPRKSALSAGSLETCKSAGLRQHRVLFTVELSSDNSGTVAEGSE